MAYKSELTNFLNDLKQHRPTLEKQQQEGRALLWDKEINLETQEAFKAAKVLQKPYVYQTK